MLWWLFASPHTRPFRDRLPVLAQIAAADRGDPVLRFAAAEAIEASGNAFFAGVTPVAEELSTLTGVRYRYFGRYHLDRESGHVDTGNAFGDIVLDAGQRAGALRLFDRVFDAMAGFVGSSMPAMRTPSPTPGPACCHARAGIPAGGPNGRPWDGLPRRPCSSATSTPTWIQLGTSYWHGWPPGSSLAGAAAAPG